MAGIVATAKTRIDAPVEKVWAALVEPEQVAKYMFGTELKTDWTVGSPIVWQGEYEGKPYEDKGEVLEVDKPNRLSVTHFSPMSGAEDKPENYHTLVYTLQEQDGGTAISLSQDNNGSDDEAEQATKTWEQMLQGLKKTVEG